MATSSAINRDFQRFKAVCVPILGSAKLTPKSIPTVSSLLSTLLQLLRETDKANLNESFIAYIFFPLKGIFERNASEEIPDQVLEKLLLCLSILCDVWWWTCAPEIWKQLFILCGSVIGGMEAKGKAKARDDETKEAAVQCLNSLIRQRSPQDAMALGKPVDVAQDRFNELQDFASSPQFIPILGQTLDYILGVTLSPRLSLQRSSIDLLYSVIENYAPERMIPTVLPGVASGMTKACLGASGNKGWINGEIVAAALKVLQVAIVKAISDDVCMREGALPRFQDLEDLVNFGKDNARPVDDTKSTPLVARTQAWLRATASQLHIAINSLSPLVKHPTPSAIYGLIDFSTEVLSSTTLTLPQTQPLLLSFLLSAANSEYPKITTKAVDSLKGLLAMANAGPALMQQLAQMTTDNMSALPRLLSSQSDARIQHVAEMITSVCKLGASDSENNIVSSISKVVGKLLGPTGGVEKWGWSLLAVLELVNPSVTVTHNSSAQLMLENNPETSWVPFPELFFRNVASHETRRSLETMLRALGQVGGDACLFSVEWFIDVGRSGTTSRSVAAMWCGCRILEGISGLDLSSENSLDKLVLQRSKRLEKQVRALARSIAELWDKSDFEELDQEASPQPRPPNEHLELDVQHQKGLVPLDETLKIFRNKPTPDTRIVNQPMLHRSLCLQLIAIAAGVLQSRFDSVFIFILYPILHSIVSPASFLSSSGFAALNYVTIATSYASPANLLLSNFDYALDSVSRRLTRRWLDIDATKVLVVLIRLVGRDVVDKAGDVVEECFDRLDAYHGYGIIVDGLIEVLAEVLNVIEADVKANPAAQPAREEDTPSNQHQQLTCLDELLAWLPVRSMVNLDADNTDYGPAPRKAWGKQKAEGEEDSDDEPVDSKQPESEAQPETSSQQLTKQIISRSLYFLTHESPVIRARILTLLKLSVPVLPESSLLPSIHNAWPFIVNRLADHETFVVSATASLVEALAVHVGSFMYRRIWDEIWPRFQTLLKQLKAADSVNALARRTNSAVGTESAYTHSHRLYKSIINTMTAVMHGVHVRDSSFWDALVLFRRFLGRHVHEELQLCATNFYLAAGKKNEDAVWLVLEASVRDIPPVMTFMRDDQWHIESNAKCILAQLGSR
ncbi:hypothetical protein CC1G_01850 [Coprinopsis cinerea okayama7|uniref:Uncharacterized protein n=1 Tax=Coprinopsis cinerea (strain Okayama-7 / 130 / ATCC MYA-4618 / FGSC 9003) TaxID=240176 RepID=A8N2U8_COPC7|nr:hypothetical protein CC1G_01850 [Coprinopsis cinerea okayama7\|eukprot:XP_001829170.1 hypothetical protein CC1G_01850 [Coprinopsis cinerea okayama7\